MYFPILWHKCWDHLFHSWTSIYPQNQFGDFFQCYQCLWHRLCTFGQTEISEFQTVGVSSPYKAMEFSAASVNNSHEVQRLHQYAALWLLCWPARIFLSLISLCCGILDFLLVIIGVSGCSHHHSLHDLHHMLYSCPGNANRPRHTPLSCISVYRTTRFSL